MKKAILIVCTIILLGLSAYGQNRQNVIDDGFTGFEAGGSALDNRLNGPTNKLFYGLNWSSADGKALAGRAPKKGGPFPVASNSPAAVK